VNGIATTAGSPNLREEPRYPIGKLCAWLALVLTISALNYAGTYLVSQKKVDTENALYHYSTAIQAVVIYGLMLLFVGWIAGWHRRPLAWRQPRNWGKALGLALCVLVGVFIVNLAIDPFLHASREQGAIPKHWLPAHAGAYAANWVVVAGVAPFVEETTYRGLGFTLLFDRWGKWLAIVAVGVLFAVSHGLFQALPELAIFGGALAWLRWKVDSTYPGMIVHSIFNSIALASVFLH
jgi:membrane protease YdiL (CAAX protease family)